MDFSQNWAVAQADSEQVLCLSADADFTYKPLCATDGRPGSKRSHGRMGDLKAGRDTSDDHIQLWCRSWLLSRAQAYPDLSEN